MLKESNSYIKNDERIKFCFPDSNGNLKVKFAENHDVSFDTFQSILTVLETKLASDENAYEEDNENNNAEKVEDDQKETGTFLFVCFQYMDRYFQHVSEALFHHSMILPFLF